MNRMGGSQINYKSAEAAAALGRRQQTNFEEFSAEHKLYNPSFVKPFKRYAQEFNFYPHETVSRYREPQLRMGKNAQICTSF